jgi:hypothetical protein
MSEQISMIRLQELRLQKLGKACEKAEQQVQELKAANLKSLEEAQAEQVSHFNTRQLVNEKQSAIHKA